VSGDDRGFNLCRLTAWHSVQQFIIVLETNALTASQSRLNRV